ncbi:flavin reductase [Tianweitania sp. BSSL-BM11]|uniref:Flavin reductase n=1 Tax=Tianweitania aestuarii TaxID=2814886 RepID=A0ABS5RZW0_9HYPH|nr:flavin reductase [Tianweitania aestuarii]MBS9721182.1 flavin reductase [Tianweitania aestuarii]
MSQDQRILRNALGSFATGVTVVTTRSADGKDIGRTANSFSSVSLEPPMILWSLAKTSSSFADYRQAKHFAVHILSADQSDISGLFASKKEDKFEDLTVERGEDQIPLLKNCAARFECRTTYQYEGGDHIIFVGEVTGFEHSSTPPLVFHGGQYGRLIRQAGESTSFEKKDSSLSPDDFIYQISRVFYQIRSEALAERRRRGWSGADYAVLTLLGHEDGRTLEEIRAIGRSRGDEITDETISKLEAIGLIKVEAATPPRAHLTGEGGKAMIEIVAMLKAAEAECLALLDENEVWVLKQLLNKLATSRDTGWPPVRQQAIAASA